MKLLSVLSLCALGLLSGCQSDDETLQTSQPLGGNGGSTTGSSSTSQANQSTSPQKVTVHFNAIDGKGNAVSCANPLVSIAENGQYSAGLADLRFFVADIALTNAAGERVPITLDSNNNQVTLEGHSVALVDFENASNTCVNTTTATYTAITGTVPKGNYSGLYFTLGVPFAINHQQSATQPPPLNSADMDWNWQFGHKFFKFELTGFSKTETFSTAFPATTLAMQFHLGSGCTGDPRNGDHNCPYPNRPSYFISGFAPDRDTVVLDLAALTSTSKMATSGYLGSNIFACHSGGSTPECAPLFNQLGIHHNVPVTSSGTSCMNGGEICDTVVFRK